MPSSACQTCALRSEEHTSELQSHSHLVCRLLLDKNEQKYLACRATTVSPGGPHRSKNQPFWNAPTAALSIITDAQITAAMNAALSPTRQFSFMKSADDVRTRLNELACSG